ncbi:MAG: hypothetical protein ACOYOI_03800, partial [Chthoniobacterales bacterium]
MLAAFDLERNNRGRVPIICRPPCTSGATLARSQDPRIASQSSSPDWIGLFTFGPSLFGVGEVEQQVKIW